MAERIPHPEQKDPYFKGDLSEKEKSRRADDPFERDQKGQGRGRILAAAVGDCVHVGGVLGFLELARQAGYVTSFLGPATPVEKVVDEAMRNPPDIVAVSYRLGPEAGRQVLGELVEAAKEAGLLGKGIRFFFGGTPPVAAIARETGVFEAVFTGEEDREDVLAFLEGRVELKKKERLPANLVERIAARAPYPLLRHHYGRPSFEETLAGVWQIAQAAVLDVISLGPDQNTQEFFFHPEDQDPSQDGAGGVPIRTPEQFRLLYEHAQTGNFPLLRCYSGTRDIIAMAEVLKENINNAWAAVPLFWYDVLDGRSKRPLVEAIRENQAVMRWHAEREVPVEVNEAHHWSLRATPDSVAVAAAYLAAYNAKQTGVRHYVAQYMFNTPAGTTPEMDLGKMLAKIELIESLHDEGFTSYRQVRAGLASFPVDQDVAKGHLGFTTLVAMSLKPHILHVVGYSEGDHAARAEEVSESCRIAQGVVDDYFRGFPDLTVWPAVQARKETLLREARLIVEAIKLLGEEMRQRGLIKEEEWGGVSGPGQTSPTLADRNTDPGDQRDPAVDYAATDRPFDPLTHPLVLARAVKIGLLDAPHLVGNPAANGQVVTRIVDGACYAVDPETGRPLPEEERLANLGYWPKRPYFAAPASKMARGISARL
ncbi:MAG: cobalamin B12-binding domain-containing protein [Firmicutes bacterium]|nr:cobalamin B12-binding domain-containing protein [Bacillota bacterium]MCL5039683.1 cobalamin B12-binding domain-containing protein [Bacillota bacterium]